MIITNNLLLSEDKYNVLFRELNFEFDKKTIIFMKGDLGSGKTTFIKQYLMHQYDFDRTSSPTFGLVNSYNIQNKLIFHYDLYRIEKESELNEIGLYDNLEIEGIHFIEWPEIIPRKLIRPNLIISLERIDNLRLITIET